MARPEYPLKALRGLRDERVEAQRRVLAERVGRTQQALGAVTAREAARRQHAERTAAELTLERERLVQRPATGVDLARIAEFEVAARAQARLLERAEAEARQALARERVEEEQAREQLVQLEAEASVVHGHEASFKQRVEEAELKAEEEAALEQWNARHG